MYNLSNSDIGFHMWFYSEKSDFKRFVVPSLKIPHGIFEYLEERWTKSISISNRNLSDKSHC